MTPVQETEKRYGWSDAAPTYSAAYLLEKVLPLLSKFKIDRLADVGTGNGANLSFFASRVKSLVGFEPDAEGFAIASHNNPTVRLHRIGVYDDPNAAGEVAFDAVISLEVIEHLFDPDALPRFAGGLLKQDGILIVSTPYHGYWKNLGLALCGQWDHHHHPDRVGGHIKFWSQKTLGALLQRNGFDIVCFLGAGRLPLLWKSMVIVARKR